jgi:TonB family protein
LCTGRANATGAQGGLNLGAAQTTRGAGLGGTGGSGGVQTSLYGKGLVNAPVGPGNNLQGGGGYGTKGRGGGQDGYGSLQLTGSAGGSPIPLGREAIVKGGIDRALIDDVVRRNLGQVRFCYEQELQADPRLAGRVVVAWVIGDDGRVSNARIHNSTLNSRNVEECILTRLRTWRFPLPEGEGNVDVNYPFLLEKRS